MTVTVWVLVFVGLGEVVVGVGVGVGVFDGVDELDEDEVAVPTTRLAEGPPEVPGWQLYQEVPLTKSEKAPPLRATVPVAVGVTTMVMVGSGMGAPWVTTAYGVAVAPTLTGVEGIGLPLGLIVPWATTVLLAVICAVASNWLGVAVGCWISHVTVTVELGVTATAGVLSSIRNGTAWGCPPGVAVQL
ncbi:hypothetical protein [Nonomuraea sp. NPDC049784]|uniref:hypothetical protein n=1 Tax=Nonomuraea sp. NPDC049784 TaxID=3154361 RepID=UPI0033CD3591